MKEMCREKIVKMLSARKEQLRNDAEVHLSSRRKQLNGVVASGKIEEIDYLLAAIGNGE